MAAYADHGLSLAERARVETHLASCPQCTALLAGVVRTVAEVSALMPDAELTAEATPSIARRAVVGALTAAAAVIAIVAAPSLVGPWLERDAGLVSLVDSVGEQRSVLGRLTGGFPHAPLGVPPAGGQGGRAAETDRVLLTAGKIRESFGDRMTPSGLHALGVSQLLAGRYDDAAQSLLAASREQPANAKYLSDLATVQLERARLGLRPDDLPRALAAADRARRLDPSLREAWFNRALAATALSLTEQAKTAWAEYLQRDSVSPWAGEARARLEELSKPTPAAAWTAIEGRLQQSIDPASADEAVRTQTTEARNFIENVLFVEWANAVLSGGTGRAELERLRVMAEAMLRVAGDPLYRDAVAAIDRAESTNGDSTRKLATAHKAYASAAAVFTDDRYVEAEAGLREGRTALTAADSPFALRAGLDLASVAYVSGRYVEASEILQSILSISRQRNYTFGVARANWIQGLIALLQGRFAEAQSGYEEALAEFLRLGDQEQISSAHNLLAALFHYIGDERRAWEHLTSALKGLETTRSPKLRHGLLINVAMVVRSVDQEAALAIQDEVVRNAEAWGREAAISEAVAQRASILASLNRSELAHLDLQRARQQLSVSTDQAFKSRLEVTVLATESELLRSSNPAAAVHTAQSAIALVTGRQDRLRLAQLQLRLAKANIVWGRTDEAKVALERGIQAFEEGRALQSDEGRISTDDEAWSLFETAVELAIEQRDYPRAFAMAERSRVRTLGEARRVRSDRSLESIQQSLATGDAVLALNQFEDQLAIWVIRRDGYHVVTRPLRRLDAQRLTASLQQDIWRESTSVVAARSLYNEIVRPVAERLSGASHLIFVPDATYKDTALSALWNPTSRRFLLEDVAISMAPSANAFATALERKQASSDVSAVAPLIFSTDFSDTRVQDVASAYSAAVVTAGDRATPGRFFQEADGRRIIHLAARTEQFESKPLLSRIVMANEAGLPPSSGILLGADIAGRTLRQTRLVVLDEVETNPSNRGEGTLHLARAFMAAGVPAVLGTLPGAEENALRDLMIAFHRGMSQGMSAEEALTTLQRNALQQNGRRLGAWTALVLYGSDR